MRSDHDSCFQINAHAPRLMRACHDQWCMSLVDATCHISTCDIRACRPLLMSQSIDRCLLKDIHMSHMCVHALDECVCHWLMSHARYTHALSDACKPLLMLPTIGHQQMKNICSLWTGGRPRPMSANRIRSLWMMLVGHARSCKTGVCGLRTVLVGNL